MSIEPWKIRAPPIFVDRDEHPTRSTAICPITNRHTPPLIRSLCAILPIYRISDRLQGFLITDLGLIRSRRHRVSRDPHIFEAKFNRIQVEFTGLSRQAEIHQQKPLAGVPGAR